MGKQTLLGVISAAALATLAFRANAADIPLLAGLIVGLVLIVAVLNFVYAHKHPVEAMLEGTEMLALQHQVLAAKSIDAPKNSPVVPNPASELPEERFGRRD